MFVTPGYAQEAQPPAEGEAHPPAAGEAHTEAEAGHGGVFPPFDPTHFASQLVWLAITFGLFYLFLKRTVVPRIDAILETRADRIASDLKRAADMKGEADAAIAAYEQELAEAKGKANAIGQQARDAAKAEAEAERKKVEASLGKKLADAEANIASIKSRAMAEVGSIAEETSAAIIEQLIGGTVDRASLQAAVKSSGG